MKTYQNYNQVKTYLLAGRIAVLSLFAIPVTCFSAKDEVKVSDFGWNADDSTAYVQAALDSGAKRVVFDRKDGPWIVRPVKGRSNTDIVFEDGVELLAKKGEFHGKRDFLLDMTDATNVTIRGNGANGGVLRMRKADYQKPPYKHSEWRYALSLLGAECVKIENMSFIASGGDGICMGRTNCRDIVIRRCRFLDNHRQGISVCGVTNLLIEDCVLSNTRGTRPAAGIDFEPDNPNRSISNCIMRNCVIDGNAGKGIDIFLVNQNGKSKPIGIRVENCRISGNSFGTSITLGHAKHRGSEPAGGIVFTNCVFTANRSGGIAVHRKPCEFGLEFVDCTISNETKGVSFFSFRWDEPVPDGIGFENLKVHCDYGQNWYVPNVNNRGLNATVPSNVTGRVTMIRPDGKTEVQTLDAQWRRKTFSLTQETPPARAKSLGVPVAKVNDLKPGEMVKLCPVELIFGARYAFFVDKPGEVRFRARQVLKSPGGRYMGALEIPVTRLPKSKKAVARLSYPKGGEPSTLSFNAAKRGWYFMEPRAIATRFLLEESNVPVAVYVGERQQQAFMPGTAVHSLWVDVAPGTERVAFIAKGGSDGALGAELFAPDGTSVAREGQIKGWAVLQKSAPAPGLWRVDLGKPNTGPRKYFQLDVTGVPGFLWLSGEKTVSFR